MAQYSFPILENDELLPCLEEMDVPLTAAQLAKPTYEIVRPLFENALTSLAGVTREELNQPVFAAIDAFEFPELHDDSVASRNFTRHITRLLVGAGVRDFGMKDVFKPDPARLRRQLSAIVNFAKFREEKLVAYTEMTARLEALLEARDGLVVEVSTAEAELRQMQEARETEKADAARVEAEAAELHSSNAALNKAHQALQAELKALKAGANELADAAQAAKFELLEARQENERLREQIVQSPERFQRSLLELQAAVDGERALVAVADGRCRELQARADMIEKVEREVTKCVELMREVEAEVARKKAASRKVKELREAIGAAQLEVADLEAQAQHLRRQQANIKDRTRKLESQASLKKDALESSLQEQLQDKQLAEAESAAQQAAISRLDAQARAATQKLRELQQAHGAAVSAVLERYRLLRTEVGAYNRRLVDAVAAAEGMVAADKGGCDAGMADARGGRDQKYA